MKKHRIIPRETIKAQTRASEPRDCVWVSANAGSGKTYVLTERVIRLLLEGIEPSKILCLTYTKAAAAVMQNRIFARLAEWARLPDNDLSQQLQQWDDKRPDGTRLAFARQLFARALETPGGLKIQTIHAFCEAILHQFPLEANIAGHFELIDDLTQTMLIGEARRRILENARMDLYPELANALAVVLDAAGEIGLQALLDEAIKQRHAVEHFVREIGGHENRQSLFYEVFGFSGNEREEDMLTVLWPAPEFPDILLERILAIPTHAVNAQKFARQLSKVAQVSDLRFKEQMLRNVFLTAEGRPKTSKTLASLAVKAILPDFAERFDRVAQRVLMDLDRLAQWRLIRLTCSAFIVIDDLLTNYQKMKRSRGLLDFEDLITRTLTLLAREGAGQWVQYKLDRGIDHILVDEAQDTSPDQWRVIGLLSDEFFSGLGQRNVRRTLFAVGDEKQSIYSFQGAVPEDFSASGRIVATKAREANVSFHKVNLKFSFRSTPDVLSAVDLVFQQREARRGLGSESISIQHDPIRHDSPGEVELWDMLTPEDEEEPDDWRVPVDRLTTPAVHLAEQIAATIRHWIDKGEVIEGQHRTLKPRDIMVLVRKRDQFVPALSRALKNLKVPVAGADRLKLTDHIAIQDLMALGRFVLHSSDDLSLAELLKSPIFSWDDEQLFALAYPREISETLFEHLAHEAIHDSALAETYETLRRWREQADTLPVFEFYARILGADGVRRKLVARLGLEAGDVIDEFQNYALSAERTGLPGLQIFLKQLEAAKPEIKRELDQNRDEVRIMTVHAAKGLEAAVVFLIDSGSPAWTTNYTPKLISFDLKEHEGWEGKGFLWGFLWRPSSEYETRFTDACKVKLKTRAEEEYRRLLYVGMTRAEDRLIVCGYRGKQARGETWHHLVSTALMDKSEIIDHPIEGVTARRYRNSPTSKVTIETVNDDVHEMKYAPLPTSYRLPMEREVGLPYPLSPSGASILLKTDHETRETCGSLVLQTNDSSSIFAIRRGTMIHHLLQKLPDVAKSERRYVAERYLARGARDWTKEEREQVLTSIFSILNDRRFASVFAEGSQAEVEMMGTLTLNDKEHTVSGKIDRLVVNHEGITIIDYKTNRPALCHLESVPNTYITQLALYRALLQPLYSGIPVKAALLFTEGPHIISIPSEIMDKAITVFVHSKNLLSKV